MTSQHAASDGVRRAWWRRGRGSDEVVELDPDQAWQVVRRADPRLRAEQPLEAGVSDDVSEVVSAESAEVPTSLRLVEREADVDRVREAHAALEVAERKAAEAARLARSEAQRRVVAEQLASETAEQVAAANAERIRVEEDARLQAELAAAAASARATAEASARVHAARAEAAAAARAEAEEAAQWAVAEREAARAERAAAEDGARERAEAAAAALAEAEEAARRAVAEREAAAREAEAAHAARVEAETHAREQAEAAAAAAAERRAAEARAAELAAELEQARAAALAAEQAAKKAKKVKAAKVKKEPPVPAPEPQPEPAFQHPAPVAVRTRGGGAAVRIVVLGVLALAGAAFTVWQAYLDRLAEPVGITAGLTTLVLVFVVSRTHEPDNRVRVADGVLHVEEGDTHRRFDLTTPDTIVEMVGAPGSRRWKVLLFRKGMAPYEVNERLVDPEEFLAAIRPYRRQL